MTRTLSSATAASRDEERAYQCGSSVRTSRSTLLSTRTSAIRCPRSAAAGERHDLVGTHPRRGLASQVLDELPPAALTRRDLPKEHGPTTHREGHLRVRPEAGLLADGERDRHLPLARDAHDTGVPPCKSLTGKTTTSTARLDDLGRAEAERC